MQLAIAKFEELMQVCAGAGRGGGGGGMFCCQERWVGGGGGGADGQEPMQLAAAKSRKDASVIAQKW
jgi:hypothetical protein